LIKKIKNELNGNTSQPKNKELYNLALKNNIKVPDQRRPTDIKKIEQPFIHGGVNSQLKYPKLKELPQKEEPKPTVLDCLSNIPKVNKPFIISDDDDDITLEAKAPAIVAPHVEAKSDTKEPSNVVPHVEANFEAKAQSNVELVMEDLNDDKPVAKIETKSVVIPENNIIKPQVTSVSESVHTTITVKEGKRILNKIKICDELTEYSDDVNKIIIMYCDRCAKDQILIALKHMTINNRLDFLTELIHTKYQFNLDDKTEILGGSKLNAIFKNLENK
jgi:hypothetical protein